MALVPRVRSFKVVRAVHAPIYARCTKTTVDIQYVHKLVVEQYIQQTRYVRTHLRGTLLNPGKGQLLRDSNDMVAFIQDVSESFSCFITTPELCCDAPDVPLPHPAKRFFAWP